jgi:uncharacterized protein
MLEVKRSKYGRGIFSTCNIKKDALIHEAPVILTRSEDYNCLAKTILSDYMFDWGEDNDVYAIALGYGSLFNHSYTPNAMYKFNKEKKQINFYAHTDIKAGEEILVNYNGTPDDQSPLWFDIF